MSEVNEENVDYLDVDDEIRGQKFTVLSFVEPEYEITEKKESYFFLKYLKDKIMKYNQLDEELLKVVSKEKLIEDRKNTLDSIFSDQENILKDYKQFKLINSESLNDEFTTIVKGKTHMRGVKSRGNYDTIEEAKAKAKKLQQNDRSFNTFIGQVGYWLPVNPDPDKLQDQEYIEKELNELVKKHKENLDNKEIFFNERKEEMLKEIREKNKKTKETNNESFINNEDSENNNNVEDINEKDNQISATEQFEIMENNIK